MEHLKSQHRAALAGYQQRVELLVELCKSNSIVPVLLTQPALFGTGKEPVTGLMLDSIVVNDSGQDGVTAWTVLEWYNDVVREVGKGPGVTVIDLARTLPKNYEYFYDFIHYTKKGAEAVSEIVALQLGPRLQAMASR